MKYHYEDEMREWMNNPNLGKRISVIKLQMVKEKEIPYCLNYISTPFEAVKIAKEMFRYTDREMAVAMSLDNRGMPLAIEIIAVGCRSACLIGMGELFKHAILTNASNIICFHNHLSLELEPSKEDINITKKMVKAGEILAINVLDHIIVGLENAYYSFKEKNMMDR